MREKEIKILWGRSGNRCAICKLELTPDGDRETLGEMAHIVARSSDGPRGDSSLETSERDKYSNLILLCPTHHSDIDKNFIDWPVEKLNRIKQEHEAWVTEQLSTGNITVSKIDNTDFLQNRFEVWRELSREHVAISLSLTPLRISSEQIDTTDEIVQKTLERATVIDNGRKATVNRFKTRPSEFGIVNEEIPELPQRSGHSIHLFKTGHCEYFQELGYHTDKITDYIQEKGDDVKGAKFVIRYTDIAEIIDCGLEWLELLWSETLPYEYLDFQCIIFNTKNTNLFSHADEWNFALYGYPTRSESLIYKNIFSKDHDPSSLELEILQWVSNCYGLILKNIYDSGGKFMRPITMR